MGIPHNSKTTKKTNKPVYLRTKKQAQPLTPTQINNKECNQTTQQTNLATHHNGNSKHTLTNTYKHYNLL